MATIDNTITELETVQMPWPLTPAKCKVKGSIDSRTADALQPMRTPIRKAA
jgi:hypothetical protein